MIKNIIIVIQFLIIGILTWLYLSTNTLRKNDKKDTDFINGRQINNPYQNSKISYEIIDLPNSTWGYKIMLNNDKPIIVQQSIPGLNGNYGFKSKEQACAVAELVVFKIKNGEFPPTITSEDLIRLNIH